MLSGIPRDTSVQRDEVCLCFYPPLTLECIVRCKQSLDGASATRQDLGPTGFLHHRRLLRGGHQQGSPWGQHRHNAALSTPEQRRPAEYLEHAKGQDEIELPESLVIEDIP